MSQFLSKDPPTTLVFYFGTKFMPNVLAEWWEMKWIPFDRYVFQARKEEVDDLLECCYCQVFFHAAY